MTALARIDQADITAANTQVLLSVIRSASASARLAAIDLDSIGTMLKAGWISNEDAIDELAAIGLLERAKEIA